jgi:hypothetical protein
MSIYQPTKPMDTTPRDPHLPPPAVCDWLLEQDWSEMIPVTLIQYHGSTPHGMNQSKLYEYQQSDPAISAEGGGNILLSVEALDVLRKDQDDRRAALEQKRQASEAERLANTATRWSQDAADRVRESCRRL